MLHCVELRAGSGPKVVFVHGFGQSAQVWQHLVPLIGHDAHILAVDLPGHGQTPFEHDTANLSEAARLLIEATGDAIYVGYSLGARVLLTSIEEEMSGPRALVLVGAKLTIIDDDARDQRQAADEAVAAEIETASDLSPFVDRWLEQEFNQRLSTAMQYREVRLANRPAGLAASLRHCGSADQTSTVDTLRNVRVPIVLVSGEKDLPKVMGDQVRMEEAIDGAELVVVPDVGHAVPFEAPQAFADLLNARLIR